MKQIRLIEFATPEYDESVRLRRDILRIPLGLDFSIDDFTNEYEDIHIGYYNEYNVLVGCLVLTELDADHIKMRQVAVSSECQGKGVGTAMVNTSEQYAFQKGYKDIVLNARDASLAFYKKMNYKTVGKEFIEVGIKHYKMKKTLI